MALRRPLVCYYAGRNTGLFCVANWYATLPEFAAGTGTATSTGDGGLASVATVNCPSGIDTLPLDLDSSVYFTQWGTGSEGRSEDTVLSTVL